MDRGIARYEAGDGAGAASSLAAGDGRVTKDARSVEDAGDGGSSLASRAGGTGRTGLASLKVKVPSGTELRWRAVPLQMSQNLPEGQNWHVLITRVILQGESGKQLNVSDYLAGWTAGAGVVSVPIYSNTYEAFTFNPESPPAGGSTTSDSAPVTGGTQAVPAPYVQATTTGFMANESNYASYSFVCTIYKGGSGTPYATVTWDPYVIVTLPEEQKR